MEFAFGSRMFFAEVAEALNCTTTEVFSVLPVDDVYVVVHTPGVDEQLLAECTAYATTLQRDKDAILRVLSGPTEIPGFMEKLKDGISTLMAEMRRDPEEDDDER